MRQNTDKEKRSKLDPNVPKIAEELLITQTSILLNKEQLIILWGAWNSDEMPNQDSQHYWSEVDTRAISKGQFKGFLDRLKRHSTSLAQGKVQEEELMEKNMQNVLKFDKGHMIA